MPPEEFRERLAGRAPVQAPERAVVEHAVDPAHLLPGDVVERPPLGQDLPDDAVAVLARPPFPWVVGLREVHLDAGRLPDPPELRELLAVVEREGVQKALRKSREQADDRGGDPVRPLRRGAGEQHEARLAPRERDEVARAREAVDEVSLPVPHAGAVLDRPGALPDVDASGDLAASGISLVLLGVPVACLALPLPHRQQGQVLVRLALVDELLAAVVLVVDRLPADHRHAVASATLSYLLGRPALAHLCLDVLPHHRRELVAGRGLPPRAPVGLGLRLLRPVALPAPVARQLARDG